MFLRAFTVPPNGARDQVQSSTKIAPAVAVAAERIGRGEGGAADLREHPGARIARSRAEALRGVLDHKQAGALRQCVDPPVIGGQAEQVYGDDPARLEPRFLATRPIASSSLSGSMFNVAGSTSTNTGVAPTVAIASAVATKANGGVKIASPRRMHSISAIDKCVGT